MIFVWNGKKADAMVKAMAISKGYELDSLLAKAKDSVLQVFFAGGVIRGKKLQRSSVLMFDENITDTKKYEGKGLETVKDNPNTPSAQQILKAYQTVYLFKWLFPESVIQKHIQKTSRTDRSQSKTSVRSSSLFTNFNSSFINSAAREAWTAQSEKKADLNSYWQRFENIDHLLEDDSDSDMDYNSDPQDQEDDVEMLEEVP